ncbi:hypothetical protein LBMAG53_10400 [Planctomycetota bacterium]|nr:hypothetical protein LBMAG53_10400 [Planctomycetota bacterium]
MLQLPRRYLPVVLGWPLAILGSLLIAVSLLIPGWWSGLAQLGGSWARAFPAPGLDLWLLIASALFAGVLMVVAGTAAVLRCAWAPRAATLSIWAGYVAIATYLWVLVTVTSIIEIEKLLPSFGPVDRFWMRVEYGWWALALVGGLGVMHLAWRCRSVRSQFGEQTTPAEADGERIVENLRSHGADPDLRRSLYGSVAVHLWILLIFPWLMSLQGCVKLVKMPPDRGNPTVVQIAMKPRKQQVVEKKIVVDKNAPIIWTLPKMDDSPTIQAVDAGSQDRYKPGQKVGKPNGSPRGGKNPGKDGPGPGGWPNGFPDGKFEFFHLKYSGSQWDDGVTAATGNADRNFLDYMCGKVNFSVATEAKVVSISQLSAFRKGFAPPFVFMTGSAGISTSRAEEKVLSDYCRNGGMLIADCGGAAWHNAFSGLMSRVFPDLSFVTISRDDAVLNQPNDMGSDGPSPMWHHGGTEFKGIKARNGRWMVVYHPGDMNDAWKDGHNGLAQPRWENALMTGENMTFYAVSAYLEETAKDRKR